VRVNGSGYTDVERSKSIKLNEVEGIWLDQENEWQLILTNKDQLVWVDQSMITFIENEREEVVQIIPDPMLVAWDLYGNKSEQAYDESLDVVIPKWLSLKAEDGSINDLYRPLYHQNVNNQGKDLWVLVNNSFDPDLTASVLNSFEKRNFLIKQLITYVDTNKIAGINVDFENMHLLDSDVFVQFVAELNTKMKENQLVLSVAVTVPGGSDNWSIVYDRERLSEVSDYLTLMAYDQHWASSQISGPVAGYSWVDGHLEDLVKTIPAHKIMLGVPFYTRVWYESLSTEVPNQMKVKSKSVFMESPQQLIDDYNPVRVWDALNSQYYFAYFKDDQLIKFWYDDEAAIGRKAALIHKYHLAGIAAWSLGFERDTVWPVLKEVKEGN
jgi:spore germination protein YaaH